MPTDNVSWRAVTTLSETAHLDEPSPKSLETVNLTIFLPVSCHIDILVCDDAVCDDEACNNTLDHIFCAYE